MAGMVTWGEIAEYVQEVHSKEEARPNPGFYRTLGNQALNIISEMSEVVSGSWDNDVFGDLTIDGASVVLPIDCLKVERVEWDGSELEFKEEAWLDREQEGWRISTGTPTCYTRTGASIVLDCIPSGVTTGKLVVRGIGMLPAFSDDPAAENPLSKLPARYALAPAYYILANLPVNVQDATETARQARYQAMWDQELASLVSGIRTRKYQAYSGR